MRNTWAEDYWQGVDSAPPRTPRAIVHHDDVQWADWWVYAVCIAVWGGIGWVAFNAGVALLLWGISR